MRQRQANFFSIQSSDFRKYSAVKTAFILSLLERGITPIMSDADVIWMRNPKEYFFRGSLADADILVSSDCVDVPSDKKDDGSCAVSADDGGGGGDAISLSLSLSLSLSPSPSLFHHSFFFVFVFGVVMVVVFAAHKFQHWHHGYSPLTNHGCLCQGMELQNHL